VQASGYRLVQLGNGAWSVHSLARGETMHPGAGPAAEAEALYARQLRLPERVRPGAEFVVWDVGLGGAANALAALRAAREVPGRLRVVSFDEGLEPLEFALAHAPRLGYLAGYEEPLRRLVQQRQAIFNDGRQRVTWEARVGDFPSLLGGPTAPGWPKPDAILYDPFSPAKNPAMWTLPVLSGLYRLLDPARECALATSSRSTMIRVTLLLAGFYVGRGQATGQKEETTVAANRLELLEHPLGGRWLWRARNSSGAQPLLEPHYRQQGLSGEAWETLRTHPQFGGSEPEAPNPNPQTPKKLQAPNPNASGIR
jgi:tRNA U34 5-methylaminomethyl-2-thiouridine-forming methyltransferase MnmC